MKKNLEGQLIALGKMYESRELAEDVYYQLVFGIAYEYMMDGSVFTSIKIIKDMPESFFEETLPILARESKVFLDMIEEYCFYLIQYEIVKEKDELFYFTNLAPGKA